MVRWNSSDSRVRIGCWWSTTMRICGSISGASCGVIAADGEAALADIREHRPDLILSDVMMPGLDGFGLVREIQADPALREVPVTLLSARAGEVNRIKGFDAGATDYLVKPFSTRELIACIGANLQLARVRSEATATLRASEQRYRALVNASTYTVYRMNSDWTEMIQLEGQGFIVDTEHPSRSWLKTYIYPDDRAQVMMAIKGASRVSGRRDIGMDALAGSSDPG